MKFGAHPICPCRARLRERASHSLSPSCPCSIVRACSTRGALAEWRSSAVQEERRRVRGRERPGRSSRTGSRALARRRRRALARAPCSVRPTRQAATGASPAAARHAGEPAVVGAATNDPRCGSSRPGRPLALRPDRGLLERLADASGWSAKARRRSAGNAATRRTAAGGSPSGSVATVTGTSGPSGSYAAVGIEDPTIGPV